MDLLAKLSNRPGGEALLAAADNHTYLVGGAVRDLLLGRTPRELDVVVEGDAHGFARKLADRLGTLAGAEAGKPAETTCHERFGTALVRWNADGVEARIDIATCRAESYPAPGALPEVRAGTREDDLSRRDFTINAIAVALAGADTGKLYAVGHALDDLEHRRLRVLHDRSFIDDPTRLLRLARYAARLDGEIEPHTAELASSAMEGRALDTISGARIGAELRLALSEGREGAMRAMERMDELGLLHAIHPRLRWERGPVERAMEMLPQQDGRADLLIMAGVALPLVIRADGDRSEIGQRAELTNLLDRLEFAATERDRIVAAASAVPRLIEEIPTAERPSWLRAVVAGVPPEGVALAGGVHEPAAAGARRWLGELRGVRLLITGEDLIAAGVPEGPEVGRRLALALDMKLDGELLDDREAELAAALDSGREGSVGAGASAGMDVQ